VTTFANQQSTTRHPEFTGHAPGDELGLVEAASPTATGRGGRPGDDVDGIGGVGPHRVGQASGQFTGQGTASVVLHVDDSPTDVAVVVARRQDRSRLRRYHVTVHDRSASQGCDTAATLPRLPILAARWRERRDVLAARTTNTTAN
jgi:hypothetical protein